MTAIRTPTDVWLAPAPGIHGHRAAVTRSAGWYFPRQSGVRRVYKRGDVVRADFIETHLGSPPPIDEAGYLVDETPYDQVLASVIAGNAGHPPEAVEADPDEYAGNDPGQAWVTVRRTAKGKRPVVESVAVKSIEDARKKGATV